MRAVLNGEKVRRGREAEYFSNKALFTKKGLARENVLHEFYHHLVEKKGVELPKRVEEKQTKGYARELVKKP